MDKSVKSYVKYISFVIAIIFIIVGVAREEHITVLTKATKICLECIGVG